ncbi:hypothetical protein [Niveispirillum irakense]|uniref:hypothetical protein n=1 Tax=Niveispirillum irakense TaxID=34011 RepID=UPI0003F5F3A1|nr:hypothetical protein [Niveispirillum irakense]
MSGNQQFDLSIYDRVEVLRGTAGMLMGTDPNPGGTVNSALDALLDNVTADNHLIG